MICENLNDKITNIIMLNKWTFDEHLMNIWWTEQKQFLEKVENCFVHWDRFCKENKYVNMC